MRPKRVGQLPDQAVVTWHHLPRKHPGRGHQADRAQRRVLGQAQPFRVEHRTGKGPPSLPPHRNAVESREHAATDAGDHHHQVPQPGHRSLTRRPLARSAAGCVAGEYVPTRSGGPSLHPGAAGRRAGLRGRPPARPRRRRIPSHPIRVIARKLDSGLRPLPAAGHAPPRRTVLEQVASGRSIIW
ncbi:MAG: hypothetical protein ACRDRK_17120 [Pseudonocardia sp.]